MAGGEASKQKGVCFVATKAFSQLEGDAAKALRGFAKLIAVIVILAVAAFGDVMYIIEMSKVFAGQGILLAFCYLGAFTSFLAIGYLLLGKSAVFRPGGQMLAAWIVFAAELIIIALNIMLIFSSDRTGFMGLWAYLSPATPVLHMFGVAIIFFLDPELKEKHKDMELHARQRQADRDYEHTVQMAKIALKHKQLEHTIRELEAAVNSEESIAHIRRHAVAMNQGLLIEMSGRSLPESNVVESDNDYRERRKKK
jgi:hypothetical protein